MIVWRGNVPGGGGKKKGCNPSTIKFIVFVESPVPSDKVSVVFSHGL